MLHEKSRNKGKNFSLSDSIKVCLKLFKAEDFKTTF